MQEAESARTVGTSSAADASAALDLWRGEALSGTRPCVVVEHEQLRLEELRLDLTERRCQSLIAAGETASVIGDLSWLCLDHPLREGLWAALITGHYLAGNQSEALRCYDRLRLALVETSGVDPSLELQQLYDDVLHQRDHLHSPGGPAPSNNVEGNLPERRTVLVGRDAQIAQIGDLGGVSVLACARALEALGDPTSAALLYSAEGWAHRTDPNSIRREVLLSRLVDTLGEAEVTELVERGAAMSMPRALDLCEAAARVLSL